MTINDALTTDLKNCLSESNSLISGNTLGNLDLPLNIDGRTHRIKRQVLVAFSGGPDSTALLLALQAIAPRFNFTVQACHINHGLRGLQADADSTFCESLCKKLKVKFKNIKLSLGETKRHFSEDNLRQMRYQHLQSFARLEGIAFIITGHTLDDQAETIMFRLFRGAALTGLTGIKPCRLLDSELYLLRPLLNVSKKQCAHFVESKGITACQDSSNLDEMYTRNYIRHKIMPAISNRFPQFTQQLESMRQILTSEDELLVSLTNELLAKLELDNSNHWSLELFNNQPLALQRRVLAQALLRRDVAVSFSRIQDILALNESHNYLNLNENWRIKRHQNKLLWQRIRTAGLHDEVNNLTPITIKVPGINPVEQLGMALYIEPYINGKHLTAEHALVDLSNVKPPLILRLRQPGDLIKPLGMTQTTKLKKYLHTHKRIKAANAFAHAQILLADQEEVLWLPGGGLSEKIKVTSNPSHSLRWTTLNDLSPIVF
jgi:tRNA(Ile)-lysidine synthase